MVEKFKYVFFIWMLSLSSGSLAQTPQPADLLVSGVPSAWRVQVYVPDIMVIYYTGSNCTSQALTMPANASAEDRNRLWALIATAKATNTSVGIYYEPESGHCYIKSYFQTP